MRVRTSGETKSIENVKILNVGPLSGELRSCFGERAQDLPSVGLRNHDAPWGSVDLSTLVFSITLTFMKLY